MKLRVGIRREDKNKWEARVPLTPMQIQEISKKFNVEIYIQPSQIRSFSNEDYKTLFFIRTLFWVCVV